MAVTLGAYLDDLCVVGGVVPSLLIDQRAGLDTEHEPHPGTNDLDIALAVALLDDERYAEIAQRLRQEGFGPDENAKGNPAVQRWRLRVLKALAFGDRAEPKDAYDLLYVLRATAGAPGSVADRLAEHAVNHRDIVSRALALLSRDFAEPIWPHWIAPSAAS